MKKIYLFLLFALSLSVFSCTPLMADLEKENAKRPSDDEKPITSVIVNGEWKVGEILTVSAFDEDGKKVTENVTYQWEYLDETQNIWIPIKDADKETYKIEAVYYNKKIRCTTAKDETEFSSEEKIVIKGSLLQENITVEIPVLINGSELTEDKIKVTAKDEEGNTVTVTDFEVSVSLPCTIDENKDIKVIVHTDSFEDMTVPVTVKAKYPAPDMKDPSIINTEFAPDHNNYKTGTLMFSEWNDEYEYSYDEGLTWTDEVKEFEPSGDKIIVRHKGDSTHEPGDPEYITYRLPIQTVTVTGNYRLGQKLTASTKDVDGDTVTKGISYQWQYFDDAKNEWTDIAGAEEKEYVIESQYYNKKIRVAASKDETEIYSDESTVSKGILLEKNITVEIPFMEKGTVLKKDDIIVTVEDEEGNIVTVTDFDVPSWIPGTVNVTKDFEITVHTEEYENVTLQTKVKVKYPVPDTDNLNEVLQEFDQTHNNYRNGTLKFKDWNIDYEYSYDDGKTWHDKIQEFTPTAENILVRHKGSDFSDDTWNVYPSDPAIISYKLPIVTAEIIGDYKIDGKLTVTAKDTERNPVTENVEYLWEYYDDTQKKWLAIPDAEKESYIIERKYYGKKIRASVTKDRTTIYSEEHEVEKGKLLPENITVTIPCLIQNTVLSKDKIKVTAVDENGNEVNITDFDVPSWLPGSVDESFDLDHITVHTELYEDIDVVPHVNVKYAVPDIDEKNTGGQYVIPHKFEKGFDDSKSGPLKFTEWNEEYEYSYDDGKTWIDEVTEFIPNGNEILIRHKGYDEYEPDKWTVYPGEEAVFSIIKEQLSVVSFEIEQNDIGLVYDETSRTFTADEGFSSYIWFVKTGKNADQDKIPVKNSNDNTFRLEDYLESMPESYYLAHPEFGKPGKYFIQCLAVYKESGNTSFVPYSATAWVELE